MKTPHTIKLYPTHKEPEFDPITGGYTAAENTYSQVPCLINFISQARVFELYGSRTEKVMICRFSQEQQPFEMAEYDGQKYKPIEAIDAPTKGAVRLKAVN